MIYNFNGKQINIPDNEIKSTMSALGLTKAEAIDLWLEDNDYRKNDEQEELNKKAKDFKIIDAREVTAEKQRKPRTVKVSDEKKAIFDTILKNLDRCVGNSDESLGILKENIKIITENKLIQVEFNGKIFEIDIREKRKPKK